MAENATQSPRPLHHIAQEIMADWTAGTSRMYAWPYLTAMSQLTSIEGQYYEDSAASIVRYFLANAQTWRGETARRIKAELKAQLETVKGRR